jgi:glycosyltransferase involved in cell wall biosynthesis
VTRLAIIVSHPTQYYSPWFRWLSAHRDFEVRVFYLWDFGVKATVDPQFQTTVRWDVDLLSGYDHEFVPNRSSRPGAEHFWGFNNPEIGARLDAWKPESLLLFGYAWATHLRVIAWARRRRVPLIFRGDSHFIGREQPSWLRRTALSWLYGRFSALTYVGAANRDYFRVLGVPDARLFFAPHAVNHELFDPSVPAHREAAQALRNQLGLAPATRVVLFAGKFTALKQPRELLEAFLALRPERTALVFVGDGEEKSALVSLATKAPPGTVHFLPFANQSEMPARYLLADVFALPSRGFYETWGLAVNEAMHMGTPALVTDRVGCQRDLVEDGKTGWVARASEPAELRAKLADALAAVSVDREGFRRRAQERVAGYSYAAAASGLRDAVAHALNR